MPCFGVTLAGERLDVAVTFAVDVVDDPGFLGLAPWVGPSALAYGHRLISPNIYRLLLVRWRRAGYSARDIMRHERKLSCNFNFAIGFLNRRSEVRVLSGPPITSIAYT